MGLHHEAACRLPVAHGEFGPFDLLAEWAFEIYVAGRADEAITACRQALLVVDPAGDAVSAAYLRYIICLCHRQHGQWREVHDGAEDLLGRLEPSAGPFWRAKVLGLQSLALMQLGRVTAALECLAEAYGLVTENSGTAYNRAAAFQSLSLSLGSALLFKPATEALAMSAALAADRPLAAVLSLLSRSGTQGSCGLVLQMLGSDREADEWYLGCASTAIRAERLAREAGLEDELVVQAGALLQFAYQRLRSEPVDVELLRRAAEWGDGAAGLMFRLALASAAARAGDEAGSLAELERVRADAATLVQPVSGWVATDWLAEMAEHRHGATDETRRWRLVARGTVQRLLDDRQGRFEQVLARNRLAQVSARVEREDVRLWEDPLTGAGNRRMLDAVLADPEQAARPTVFVDVDYFKDVNDLFGHEVGDVVLRRVAGLLQQGCRPGDVVARYGGDEFVVVLAEAGNAHALAARLSREVEAADWQSVASGLHVTITAGAAPAGPGALARADSAVLAAKAARSAPRELALAGASVALGGGW